MVLHKTAVLHLNKLQNDHHLYNKAIETTFDPRATNTY